MLGKNSADDILKYFSKISQKKDMPFQANCLLTICMKYQILFLEKKKKKKKKKERKKKKNSNVLSAAFAQKVAKDDRIIAHFSYSLK